VVVVENITSRSNSRVTGGSGALVETGGIGVQNGGTQDRNALTMADEEIGRRGRQRAALLKSRPCVRPRHPGHPLPVRAA
jgi:hypothetical protein